MQFISDVHRLTDWAKFGWELKKEAKGSGLNPSSISQKTQERMTHKGLMRKVLQIKSMRENQGGLASELLDAFTGFTPEQVQSQLLKNGLGKLLDLQGWGETPKIASLSEVHQLQGLSGEALAVKMLFPEVEEELRQDSRLMSKALGLFENFGKGFPVKKYEEFLSEEFLKELDLKREFAHQLRFWEHFQSNPKIRVPKPIEVGAKGSVLVSQYLSSMTLAEFIEVADQNLLRKASDLVSQFYWQCFFELNLLHCDPNPGNFGFKILGKEVQLVIYDFGSVYEWPKTKANALLKWLLLAQKGDRSVVDPLKAIGFEQALIEPLQAKLPALSHILWEPLLLQGRYNLKSWNRKGRIMDLLGEKRWNFMASAAPSVFPAMRALAGWFYYCENLSGDLFLGPLLQNTRQACLPNWQPEQEPNCQSGMEMAKSLHVEVFRDEKKTVALDLPFYAVEKLEDFIDPDTYSQIKQNGIDLNKLIHSVREDGYRAKQLFLWEEGTKKVEVSLR